MDHRIIFEEMAMSLGLPNPTDDQIQKIIQLHNSKKENDNEIIELYKQVKSKTDEILSFIDEEDDKEYYEQYFQTYPMLYFSLVPRHMIKHQLNKNPVIWENIFASIPSPIDIQDDKYDYIQDDMKTYHNIYKSLNNENEMNNFILNPIDFIETLETEFDTDKLIKTIRFLKQVQVQ